MGLFSFLKGDNNRFVTEKEFNSSASKQKQMNTETLEELFKYGINYASELMLEFFFYTNTQDKASNLAIELKKFNYQIDKVDTAASDKKLWVINGWTTKMKVDLQTVTNWTTQMCKVGYDNDCDFDGWGTDASQDEKK
jgi:regulator of RNase E activity RraB